MVNFPPTAPSFGWWRAFFKSLAQGASGEDAIQHANKRVTDVKEFARYTLLNPNGEPVVLTLPVEGGARLLRKINSQDLKISEHGEWRKNHAGALEACLGKTPFYRYFEKGFLEVLSDKNLSSLESYNLAIFRVLYSFLMQDIPQEALQKEFERQNGQAEGLNPCVKERGKEIAALLNPEISIIEAMSQFGRETLLAIFAVL